MQNKAVKKPKKLVVKNSPMTKKLSNMNPLKRDNVLSDMGITLLNDVWFVNVMFWQ